MCEQIFNTGLNQQYLLFSNYNNSEVVKYFLNVGKQLKNIFQDLFHYFLNIQFIFFVGKNKHKYINYECNINEVYRHLVLKNLFINIY